jgi:adenylate cyclase
VATANVCCARYRGRGYRLAVSVSTQDSVVAPDPVAPAVVIPSDPPMIAVLPFQNMSGDPDQEYFADGMVEEIITALAHSLAVRDCP